MSENRRPTYGTTTAEPDKKVRVEVGGGEKSAAQDDETKTGRKADPDSRREQRPEGPHATPENTNDEATPGVGTLPDAGDQDATGG